MVEISVPSLFFTNRDGNTLMKEFEGFFRTIPKKKIGCRGWFPTCLRLLPENTDQLLKDVKICDLAIGLGAFPMGLLKELFLCRTVLEGISQHQVAEIKKHIIQQNVYGVDIERGAVDIARLRFWLSLIVNEETP